MPREFVVDDSMINKPLPPEESGKVTVYRGPTIVVPEASKPLPSELEGQVLLKCGDKITTDHIMPAGPFLKYRSNVPLYSKYVFNCFNEEGQPTFAERSLALKQQGISGIVVAAESYGQGSSREHAALCPMYLGVRAVLAKTIERIHKANLINFAIVPVEFENEADYDRINAGDVLRISDLLNAIKLFDEVKISNMTSGFEFKGRLSLSSRDRRHSLAGGC
jgi:aconitate hydratase